MKGTLLFRVVALAGLASAALFVAQPASAVSWPAPTITSGITPPDGGFQTVLVGDIQVPIEVSVFENRHSYTILEAFTITNPDSYQVNLVSYAVGCDRAGVPTSGCSTFLRGDRSDIVTGDSVAGGGSAAADGDDPACGTSGTFSLAAHESCTVIVTLTLPGEVDYGDYGISEVTLRASYYHNGTQSAYGDLPFAVQVKDAPVPEPGSLLLLGTGMLGLAGVLRRKLGRN